MKVVCTGPESSGTRLLTRIVAAHGVEAVHRSIPDGKRWDWPQNETYDAAVVIVRSFYPAARSQVQARHSTHVEQALDKLRSAIAVVGALPYPWYLVTFGDLIARPDDVVRSIAGFLGVEPAPLPEPITDENRKWYE